MNTGSLTELLVMQLDDFAPGRRAEALKPLAGLMRKGEMPRPAPTQNANLHIHSFYSYNADGHSPTRIAWEAKRTGLFAAGIVEFDVLDGIDEFLAAGDELALRAVVGVESRVFIPEYADREINSPGEPGISYHMGEGFVRLPEAGTPAAATLARMRSLARSRNEQMVARINAHLVEAAIEYENDVLPLTPSGNATERHLLAAYERKAREAFRDFDVRAAYWSRKLGEETEKVKDLFTDTPKFHELLRAKLMKRGGVGYVPPASENFPTLDEMNAMTAACGAIPCLTWLDGSSAGEHDPRELVEFHRAKGALAINVIPDRNWRLADPSLAKRRRASLYAIVEAAGAADLVVIHGTERNKAGLPAVDDLSCEALAPVAEALRQGAYAAYGHTALTRFAGRPLGGAWSAQAFGSDAAARNRFYVAVGRLLEPGPGAKERLAAACASDDPDAIVASLSKA
jgi:hypothetical protein